ncbi:afadin- and alpha-actinin-binding protein B-like [Xenia sp. Carnegie-2017]|uniref:afadin- and alpha-actinin-binding protein B-like n=1 Tax=Xenia sp. Carnegie-2017 TaxID=2897299 RepID=UPI001F03CF7A|nr:afadin- and alpha-actinin-binding protein B-like [Xenia sp. Carnegie-2017]
MTGKSPDIFEKYMSQTQTSPDTDEQFYGSSEIRLKINGHGRSFCNEDNIDQCITYLDQELVIVGFASLYKNSDKKEYSIVKIINNLYELLLLQIRNNKIKDEMEIRQQRSDSDNEYLVQNQTRLKNELDLLQREIAQLKSKQIELSKVKKSLDDAVKSQKEEIKKMKGNQQYLRKQFEHDVRKSEREMVKLKEKLVQTLNHRTKDKSLGMDMLNCIQRTDGKRRTWNTTNRQDEDMYRLVVRNYEEKQKELMEENNDLRELLQLTERELVLLLNDHQGDVLTESGHENDSDNDVISIGNHTEGHYQMPFELVREGIAKSIHDKWSRLKEEMENTKKDDAEINHEKCDDVDVHKLQNELDRYKYIVMQQEEQIQKLQDNLSSEVKTDFMNDSAVTAQKDKIEKEMKLFKQEKSTFDEERKRFTEAAIELSQDRERFNEERALFLKQQLLSLSPRNDRIHDPRKAGKDEARLPKSRTQTPVFSVPNRKMNNSEHSASFDSTSCSTPNTADLYSALNLKTKSEHLAEETPRGIWNHDSLSSSQNSCSSDPKSENHLSTKNLKRIGEHARKIKKALLEQQNNVQSPDV